MCYRGVVHLPDFASLQPKINRGSLQGGDLPSNIVYGSKTPAGKAFWSRWKILYADDVVIMI